MEKDLQEIIRVINDIKSNINISFYGRIENCLFWYFGKSMIK